MLYRVQLAPSVAKTFSTFHPQIRIELKNGLKTLAKSPYVGKILQDELAAFFTFKIRRYRIIYTIVDEQKIIKIFMIGHRKDIYDILAHVVRNNSK